MTVAFRSAKERNFRGAKGDDATEIVRTVLNKRTRNFARMRIVTNFDLPPFSVMKVAVLAGGDSSERDVSLKSGAAVRAALSGRGHHLTTIDPMLTDLNGMPWDDFDAVFIALHGTFGEDGQLQRILEAADVPFTGSDSQTSQLAFSKSASKERFASCGVPTLPYVLIHESDDAARISQQAEAVGFPCVVKPDGQGSSLGVSLVKRPEQLPAALSQCFHYDPFGIVETYVKGSEWTIGLLDDDVFPAIQIATDRPFFNYGAKYEDETTRYLFESAVADDVVASIQRAGRRAGEVLETSGPARADLMLDRFLRPWVLEVNTVPGMTSHSLLPKAAARAGMNFAALCEAALHSALARTPRRQGCRQSA